MKTFRHTLLCLVAVAGFGSAAAQSTVVRVSNMVREEYVFFPAFIDGRDFRLEAMVYRPDDLQRHPMVIFSHGRNGPNPARDPATVFSYQALCRALASQGRVVVFFVRRGYGNSEGPDSELQDTAVLSGLEAAKDYKGAVEYWRAMDYVQPDKVVLMGQSQGGWDVLAGTNVGMPGVLGAVNISGGTNYRLMGSGAITTAVQDHWVEAAGELGARALVPSYWIYSENDLSISGPTARRMFAAYTAAGGRASLLMLPAYGSNGHAVVEQPGLFSTQLDSYFETIGFSEAEAAPIMLPATPPPVTISPAPAASTMATTSSGGGGGAPSLWFFAALTALAFGRAAYLTSGISARSRGSRR